MGYGEDSKKITKTVEMEKKMWGTSSNTSSRDLLQRFRGTASGDSGAKMEENEEIELNLGLSLGGRFGVDRSTNKLVRSSSIGAACLPVVVKDDDDDDDVGGWVPQALVLHSGLVRTSSLPVESEEEWRKRKEMQGLRRMQAKKRRSEKQRNLRSEREGGGGGGGSSMSLGDKKEIEVNLRGELQREKSLRTNSVSRPMGLSMWAGPKKGKESCSSDLESKPLQGSGELSPTSIQSLQKASNQEIGSSALGQRKYTKSDIVARNRGREININALEEMPCVFTKGDGPNGRRVDGILYKYGKGEEVRIMCVCHGTFHSPAEFVSHAGGTDLDSPLKHIVVNPNAASLV